MKTLEIDTFNSGALRTQEVPTHHKIVVLGGFGHEFRPALSNPDADLHVAGVLALLGFAHFAHNPAKTKKTANVIVASAKSHVREKQTLSSV